ncbi:MAG TPA: NAD(P)-dependent alcohol dehydrogenase [Clostridia bacterium]|nr:NAD(P)-dependent alcohol dehydrogenase [Clostridia bacterium]
MSTINRNAFLDKNHNLSILEMEIPRPSHHELVIKIMSNGICGSDIQFYNDGRLGNFVVTDPYVPGHEASGVVVEVGSDIKDISVGDRVVVEPGIPCGQCYYCRIGRYNLCKEVIFLSAPPINGTFCDYLAIRSDCVHKIPKGLSFEQASLAEPVAVAVHAINRAHFNPGATAVIVGAGPIGLLTLQAFKCAGGSKAICIDRVDRRLEIAKELGADEVINIQESNSELYEVADVIFETAGSTQATQTLFNLARVGGCVVQVGWPGDQVVDMNIANFIDKELDYVAVNRYANAFPTAIAWMADGRINVEKLITHRYSFDQVNEAFRYTGKNPDEVIKTVVVN